MPKMGFEPKIPVVQTKFNIGFVLCILSIEMLVQIVKEIKKSLEIKNDEP